MHQLVKKNLEKLEKLCELYHVEELYLFGSAASGRFRPGQSDFDFLVNFQPMTSYNHLDAYMGLTKALEELLGTSVDLVEEKPLINPFFKEEIEETKVMLYAA